MYVKFFGQEIAFANIDKAIVEQIIEVHHLLFSHTVWPINNDKNNILNWKPDISWAILCVQVASGPSVNAYGRKALDALLSGFTLHYAKPLLVAEVRRILPTSVGLPMELSFYTAAVAAASVVCKYHSCSLTYLKYLFILILEIK